MYPNLEAELKRLNISRNRVAKILNCNVSTVSMKLTKYGRLKLAEARIIQETLFPELTLDYLFKTNDIKAA